MMVLGGSGSLGTELAKQYHDKYNMIAVARGEERLWALKNKYPNVRTTVCDVREKSRVKEVLLEETPDILIIAQALKQIDLCEALPIESIKTNIIGTVNIAECIKELHRSCLYRPKIILFVSTDKSPNSVSTYGTCKYMSEKLVFNLADHFEGSTTRVNVCRYGNVAGSNGSLLKLLPTQAVDPNVKAFTLTHPLMSRFLMKIEAAVQLIDFLITSDAVKNGDLVVPQLPSVLIEDVMRYFSKRYNKPYTTTGLRGTEKLAEIMLTREERMKVSAVGDYFIYNKNNEIKDHNAKEFSSDDFLLTLDQVTAFLDEFLSETK